MKIKILLILFYLSVFLTACTQKEKTCVITGKVINRPQSTQLRLTKAFVDFRSQSAVLIPIKDSTFNYEFNFKDIEAYNLVFQDEFIQGSMRPIIFFTTNSTVNMELYPMEENNKNIITGGKENNEFLEYQKKMNDEIEKKTKHIIDSLKVLQANDEYNSQIMKDLYKKLENTEKQEDKFKLYTQINELYQSGEGLSPAAKKLNAQNDSLRKIIQDKEIEFIKENTTIPNYYTLIQAILSTKDSPEIFDFDELSALQKKYAAKYKNHPYTNYSNEVSWRFANMKPGGDFFDFKLPELNGKEHSLSEEIKGKYAFIDIWAPWCGPCIAKSREMKPIFEDYKNKGFTVIGVASKYQEISDVEKLLEKDKYPWITLIDKPELDSRINEHYGIEMAGGGCVLVDKAGKIVLVNPSVEEVKKVLETAVRY
jgi:thiol-disulfide isomerase/thioredoxin